MKSIHWALAQINQARDAWVKRRDALVEQGLSRDEAAKRLKQDAAALKGEADAWDHHRKLLSRNRRSKPGPVPSVPKSAPAALVAELERKRAAAADRVAEDALLAQARARVAELRKQQFAVGDKIPNHAELCTLWGEVRDKPKEEGGSPWWPQINRFAFTTAFEAATTAHKAWLDSLSGKRAGRRVGYPRFKRKGRCRDSFRLHHDVKKPGIRPEGYRRLRLPTIGSVRLHQSAKRLVRLLHRGQAVVQSVTVSRSGHRWFASVLCKVQQDIPDRPNRRQQAAGVIGVDWGVNRLVTTTAPLTLHPGGKPTPYVPNPKFGAAQQRRLAKAQRAYARTQRGSKGRERAAKRIGRIHHELAERRATYLHTLTKRLATGHSVIAIEDLDVVSMTASARGTVDKPGRRVRQKAGLNRAILDASPGEFRRQLTYKTHWYGSQLVVCDRQLPSSKTCSACGRRKPSLPLSERIFTCECGLRIDRDLNAARNLAAHATEVPQDGTVASGRGETQNARGVAIRPTTLRGGGQATQKRKDSP